MDWDINSIRILAQVGASRSMTDAADVLGLSPSTVSKAMTRLEAALGARLLHRTTRSVHLTPEGATFLQRCRGVLQELDDAAAELGRVRSLPSGRLRLLVPVGFGRQVVIASLPQFLERFPGVTLNVELSDRAADLALEGLDAIITIGPPPDSGLVAHRLGRYRMLCCAAPAYLKRYGEPTVPDDLDRHQCLAYALPQSPRHRDWVFTRNGSTFRKTLSGPINVNHAESLLQFALAGLGIVQLSTFVTAGALRSGALKPVLADYASLGPEIMLAYLPNRNQSARVRAFRTFMEDVAGRAGDLQPGPPRPGPPRFPAQRKAGRRASDA